MYINILDAQATLQSLMEDRATLGEQLAQLKSDPELADTPQIQQLEEDIELRSAQIGDLQQKILDFDEGYTLFLKPFNGNKKEQFTEIFVSKKRLVFNTIIAVFFFQ